MTMPEHRVQTEGTLFELVQGLRIFPDSKTFPDSIPMRPATDIEREFADFIRPYEQQLSRLTSNSPGSNAVKTGHVMRSLAAALESWVRERFILPGHGRGSAGPMEAHIENLWSQLLRLPPHLMEQSSLLSLPHPYMVPGGRYVEMYYWDSYFTCIGLLAAGHSALIHFTADNFAHFIQRYGYIPNGSRTYYLGRSQAPFFSFLIRLLEKNSA